MNTLNEIIYKEFTDKYGVIGIVSKNGIITEEIILLKNNKFKIEGIISKLLMLYEFDLNAIKYLLNLINLLGFDFNNTEIFLNICRYCSLEIIKYCIDINASIHIIDKNNNTTLHQACKSNTLDVVVFLITSGVDINKRNKLNHNILHVSCKNHKNLNVIIPYILTLGIDKYELNLLYLVGSCGTLDIINFIISLGYDINGPYSKLNSKINLLDVVCTYNENIDVVQYFIDTFTVTSKTLYLACEHNNSLDVVKLIFSKLDDNNILFYCYKNPNREILKYFVAYDLNPINKSQNYLLNSVNYFTLFYLMDEFDIGQYIVDFRPYAIRDIPVEKIKKLIDKEYKLDIIFKYITDYAFKMTDYAAIDETVYKYKEGNMDLMLCREDKILSKKQRADRIIVLDYILETKTELFNKYYNENFLSSNNTELEFTHLIKYLIKKGYNHNIKINDIPLFNFLYSKERDVEYLLDIVDDIKVDTILRIYQHKRFIESNKDKLPEKKEKKKINYYDYILCKF